MKTDEVFIGYLIGILTSGDKNHSGLLLFFIIFNPHNFDPNFLKASSSFREVFPKDSKPGVIKTNARNGDKKGYCDLPGNITVENNRSRNNDPCMADKTIF